MRNALLYLALPLTLLYLLGGSEALVDALTKVVVLSGVQLITHYLDQSVKNQHRLKQVEERRLKK
jgi:hypothetical protein